MPDSTAEYEARLNGDLTDPAASYKDSREQFEQRTHKRLIDIINPTQKTTESLSRIEMPAGVYIDIKMKQK